MSRRSKGRRQNPLAPRLAVLSRHDLSSIDPGEKVHVYNKIMALAKTAPLTLFTPNGHSREEMRQRMNVVEVSPAGLHFILMLIPTLIAHRAEYDSIYSRDIFLILLAFPMRAMRKKLIIELNGMPSLEVRIQRETRKVKHPRLTPLVCGLIKLSEILAFRSANLVLPVTEKMSNIVRNYGVNPEKVTVVPNAVDTTVFRPLQEKGIEIRRRFGISNETVVLYVSSFSVEWRGSKQLVEVIDRIYPRRRDIVFLVVGSGPLLEEMKAKIARASMLDRVFFSARIDRDLVPSYLSAADLYVHDVTQVAGKLIEREGLCPTKILEAMACGKPVIAPKESELEAMLRKANGGFCAVLEREVSDLIERFADCPDLAKSMGKSALEYARLHHDLARWATTTIEMIRRIS